MDTDIAKKLQEPFHPNDIEWRVGATTGDKTKGIALAYVTNRAIQNRLDSIFGPFGWKNEFREWKGNSQLCGISVRFGDEWITKWDGADDSNTEATKGGLSDAMKRAGYQWGIGRYLYNLENTWVPIKQQGKSYVLVSEPRLPEWAVPEGFSYQNKPNADTEAPTEAPPEEPVKDENINEIERQSKLNLCIAKWQTLSGEKDKEKDKLDFCEYLSKKGQSIDSVTYDFLVVLEESLTKKLINKKKGSKAS